MYNWVGMGVGGKSALSQHMYIYTCILLMRNGGAGVIIMMMHQGGRGIYYMVVQ